LLFGPENVLVRRLESLVREPHPAGNPLVICGNTGTGKTSLAMLLVDLRAQHLGTSQVFRTTGADFARAASNAHDTDSVTEYRSRMGRADVVLLDDLHRLAGRATALEELQNRLDGWLRRGSLVIATLKHLPAETEGLSGTNHPGCPRRSLRRSTTPGIDQQRSGSPAAIHNDHSCVLNRRIAQARPLATGALVRHQPAAN
jgi:chromosomal replication initiation ATPase DnaA